MRYISTFTDRALAIGVASEAGTAALGHRQEQGRPNAGAQTADDYAAFEMPATDTQGAALPVAVVASGRDHGGHAAEAAELVVNTIYNALRAVEAHPLPQRLTAALEQANQALYQAVATDAQLSGLGVAVAVAVIAQNTLYLAYVGNCHVYLIRQGTAYLLTAGPHALDDADFGDGAQGLPVNATPLLGRAATVTVTTTIALPTQAEQGTTTSTAFAPTQLVLQPDDHLVLCTAGLNAVVPDRAIATAVTTTQAQDAAWALVDQAGQAGAAQSYTVLILQRGHLPQPNAAPVESPGTVRRAYPRRKVLVAALGLVLLILSWPLMAALPQRLGAMLPAILVEAQERSASQASEAAGISADVGADLPAAGATDLQVLPSPGESLTQPLAAAAVAGRSALGADAAKRAPRPAGRGALAVNPAARTELQPLLTIVDRLRNAFTLTDTLQALQQRAADSIALASTAADSAQRATAEAVPTATPRPTLTPIPTVAPPPPTPTPSRRTNTVQARPAPTRVVTAPVAPAPEDLANAKVTLIEPVSGDTLAGKRPFLWQANFTLPPGYAFEVLFWQPGQDPMTKGKGYGGSTTGTQLNAAADNFHQRNAPEGEYRWGVILIKSEPYQRIKFLGGDQVIYVRN